MALKRNMTCAEMVEFIDNDLLHQAKIEMRTWIWPPDKHKITGGYFVVSRQIFCMIDFLGAVFSGYPMTNRKADPEGRHIADGEKAKEFITKFFEPKSTYTKAMVDKLYRMYRHGLVHLYQPRVLRFGKRGTINWGMYRGARNQAKIEFKSDNGAITFYNISHLQIVPNKQNQINFLVICIDSLYEDFEKAILTYRDKLSKTKSLQRKWRTAVNAICKPR